MSYNLAHRVTQRERGQAPSEPNDFDVGWARLTCRLLNLHFYRVPKRNLIYQYMYQRIEIETRVNEIYRLSAD